MIDVTDDASHEAMIIVLFEYFLYDNFVETILKGTVEFEQFLRTCSG